MQPGQRREDIISMNMNERKTHTYFNSVGVFVFRVLLKRIIFVESQEKNVCVSTLEVGYWPDADGICLLRWTHYAIIELR